MSDFPEYAISKQGSKMLPKNTTKLRTSPRTGFISLFYLGLKVPTGIQSRMYKGPGTMI